MPGLDIDVIQRDLQRRVEDGFYVTVGFAVIAFQRAQVRRRELRKQLRDVVDRNA